MVYNSLNVDKSFLPNLKTALVLTGVLVCGLLLLLIGKVFFTLIVLDWDFMALSNPASFALYILALGGIAVFVLYKLAKKLFMLADYDIDLG